MRLGELRVDLVRRDLGGVDATSFWPGHSASAPRSAAARASSRRRGCAARSTATTGSSVSRHAARIGRAPFLFPAARTRPVSGCPPSMTNDSRPRPAATVRRQGGATIASRPPVEPTRERAWETLTRYTKSEALLRHALAVEASTAFYARRYGEDEELWRVPRSSTTSTTRSTRRSTSTRRTARRSCARRATPRR